MAQKILKTALTTASGFGIATAANKMSSDCKEADNPHSNGQPNNQERDGCAPVNRVTISERINKDELVASVEVLRAHPEIITDQFPIKFSDVQITAFFDYAQQKIKANPNQHILYEEIGRQLNLRDCSTQSCQETTEDAEFSTSKCVLDKEHETSDEKIDPFVEWEALQDKFKCGICRDLLAAPTIVNGCGHSFCGICLVEHKEKCTSDDADVVCHCPNCRAEFEDLTFEHVLDANILSEVERIENGCSSVTVTVTVTADWRDRRSQYFQSLRKPSLASGDAVKSPPDDAGTNRNDELANEALKGAVVMAIIAFATALLMNYKKGKN